MSQEGSEQARGGNMAGGEAREEQIIAAEGQEMMKAKLEPRQHGQREAKKYYVGTNSQTWT